MSDTVWFLSDVHLGAEPPAVEAAKERDLLELLDRVAPGDHLYLLGDLFDFWFDTGAPPPGGRYAAALRGLGRATARGARVAFMGGNHDTWARAGRRPGWLERGLGIALLEDPTLVEHQGVRLLLTHGDALGGARGAYRWVRAVLRHPLSIAGYRLLPARLAYAIADRTSRASRGRHHEEDLARHRAALAAAAAAELARAGVDAVVAGHVHVPERIETADGVYLNLGDWMIHRTYGRLAEGRLALETFSPEGEAT